MGFHSPRIKNHITITKFQEMTGLKILSPSPIVNILASTKRVANGRETTKGNSWRSLK
jgi:hypothetical protein